MKMNLRFTDKNLEEKKMNQESINEMNPKERNQELQRN